MEKKMDNNKPKDLGAAWIKSGNYGDYISVSLEIDGKKHNFTMFPNKYKKEGSNQPDYRLPAPQENSAPKVADKYEAQLNAVMAQKQANKSVQYKQINASVIESDITESEIPF